jgi:aminomethyltransferase
MAATEQLLRTPLFEAARSAGGRMVPFAGWELAVQYGGLLQEHQAVRQRAGLFDISHMGVLRLRGDGVKDALQALVPSDLFRIGPGEACYTVLLNDAGGIRDDLIVYDCGSSPDPQDPGSRSEELLVVINAACATADTDWLSQNLAPQGIRISDAKGHGVLLALQGPQAAAQLERLSSTDLSGLPRFGHRRLQLGSAAGAAAGAELFVGRTGYTGEDGFELLLEGAAGLALWQELLTAGVEPCGLGARDSLRLEAAMHLYGSDLDTTTTPLEAGLGWLVHLEMPKPFVGREALEQQTAAGVRRRLVGLQLQGRAIPRHGYPVLAEGAAPGSEPVGTVTSGGWSPCLEAGIALALVPAELARLGTQLAVEIRGRTEPATVVKRPFYRR